MGMVIISTEITDSKKIILKLEIIWYYKPRRADHGKLMPSF